MNEKEEKEDRQTPAPMTRSEFAQLGDGEVAYIKQLDSVAAERLFDYSPLQVLKFAHVAAKTDVLILDDGDSC